MSNEKIIALLQAFRANDLDKALKKLQVANWQILINHRGGDYVTECMVNLPISVDFLIIIESANTTHQMISDVKQNLVKCLSTVKDHFYTYDVHTQSSLKSYLVSNKLSDEHTINQCLAKADNLDNLITTLEEYEDQHKKKLKNLDVTSATLLSQIGSWKGTVVEKSSPASAIPTSDVSTSSFALVPH